MFIISIINETLKLDKHILSQDLITLILYTKNIVIYCGVNDDYYIKK